MLPQGTVYQRSAAQNKTFRTSLLHFTFQNRRLSNIVFIRKTKFCTTGEGKRHESWKQKQNFAGKFLQHLSFVIFYVICMFGGIYVVSVI